jgi:UrcA family protein
MRARYSARANARRAAIGATTPASQEPAMFKSLIAVAAVAASVAVPGHARPADERMQVRIPIGATDLTTPQGQTRLAQRVDRMIRNACQTQWHGMRGVAMAQGDGACRMALRADAEPKLLALRTPATRLAAR